MNEQLLLARNDYPQTLEDRIHLYDLRSYPDNRDPLRNSAKEPIDNFLKTMSEIDNEFENTQQQSLPAASNFEVSSILVYMEENY